MILEQTEEAQIWRLYKENPSVEDGGGGARSGNFIKRILEEILMILQKRGEAQMWRLYKENP